MPPTEEIEARAASPPAPPRKGFPARTQKRLFRDRLARRVVSLSGMAVIGSILAIILVIAFEVYPLFRPPRAAALPGVDAPGETPLWVGLDEYREIACLITPSGVRFISAGSGAPIASYGMRDLAEGEPGNSRISAVFPAGPNRFALGLTNGKVVPLELTFALSFEKGRRRVQPGVVAQAALAGDPEGKPIRALAFASGEAGIMLACARERAIEVLRTRESRALAGERKREEVRSRVSLSSEGEITALAWCGWAGELLAGTSSGQVHRVHLGEMDAPSHRGAVDAAGPGAGVTALGFLLGDRTMVVGDSGGRVGTWQLVQAEHGARRLAQVHRFEAHPGPVRWICPSQRGKGFITADPGGQVRLHHATTGQSLLALTAPCPAPAAPGIVAAGFAPRGDGIVAAGAGGGLSLWEVRNPHPEASLKGLFGKLWYEGYDGPEYVWQSTGATDDFESKMSLVPLVYGTLKGTFYALIFAIPLALLGALYTSQFMHASLKSWIKPTVEIMAALPSVVLGFIAGLWLAPAVEKVVPGLFLLPAVMAGAILLALFSIQLLPRRMRGRLRPGSELFIIAPLVVLAAWLSFGLGALIETDVLKDDYRSWLYRVLGLTYDQRNSLVVGFAMGFAVIPIIFTIAEDSLSNVPQHLKAGSLALGATRWQTALRVVLPTASPGIFSAIMIGFGRAVGETMIVLMATGNTPVMDWSVFNGFRALSANIAVELPEAPEGETLYRVLFLAAFLLFVVTFIVNTAAELVRLRLRKRYRVL